MAMRKNDSAYLVTESYAQDDYGVLRKTTVRHQVYVNVSSVTSQEWFEGGRNGLNPQLRFTLFQFDYTGEHIIEYSGKQYTIYRTYARSKDELELYCEFRKGNE